MGFFKDAKRLRDGLKVAREMQSNNVVNADTMAAIQAAQAMAAQAMAGQPSAVPTGSIQPTGDDRITRLAIIGQLHADGALSDEEFATQKARILAED